LIFNRAIPPHALLDPALFPGDRSPWSHSLRLMKSIVLVCRSWNKVGAAFLYQHIYIRRLFQLECLRETLSISNLSPRNLGALVKSLYIQCYIPEEFAPEFAEILCAVVKLCPFLSTFGYTSPCALPLSVFPTSCLKSKVTRLQLHDTVHYVDLVSILRDLQDQLLVLHVSISYKHLDERLVSSTGSTLPVVPDPKTTLIFPSLLTLSISPPDGESAKPHVLSVLKADWSMPSLEGLAISLRVDSEVILDFLSTHGRRLLYLRVVTFAYHFSRALEQCPLLERLVVPPATFNYRQSPKNQVLHTKLRFLDVAYSFRPDEESPFDNKIWISKKVVPSLQLVRHLCNIPSYISTWIDSFEPSSEIGSDNFTIRMFQHQVVYRDGVLLYDFKPETPWRFSVWEDMAIEYTEDKAFDLETSSSSDESSSEDDEEMFDSGDEVSGDEVSTLSP